MLPHSRGGRNSSDTQTDGSDSGRWFTRRTNSSSSHNRDHNTSPTPHYTLRRPPTPPPRVLSPTGVAGRDISAPLENPSLLPALSPKTIPSPPPLRTRQISAPSTNPTLTSESFVERNSTDDRVSRFNGRYSKNGVFSFPRPPDLMIEQLFNQYLKSRDGVLGSRSTDQKWRLLYQDEYLMWAVKEIPKSLPRVSPNLAFKEDSPEWYISQVSGMTITPQEAEWLHVSLRHNSGAWFQSFIDMQGLYSIALYLALSSRGPWLVASRYAVQFELVKCLQHIFNSKVLTNSSEKESGAIHALKHDGIVSQIASALNGTHLPTLKLLTDILILFTQFNDQKAFLAALKALNDLSLMHDKTGTGTGRYDYWFSSVESILVNKHALYSAQLRTPPSDADDGVIDYALSTLTLINSIVDNSKNKQFPSDLSQMQSSGLDRIVKIAKAYKCALLDRPLSQLQAAILGPLGQNTRPAVPAVELGSKRAATPPSPPSISVYPPLIPNLAPNPPPRKPPPVPIIAVTEEVHPVNSVVQSLTDPDDAANSSIGSAPAHLQYFDPRTHNTRALTIQKHNTRALTIRKRNRSTSTTEGSSATSQPVSNHSPPASIPLRSSSMRERPSKDDISPQNGKELERVSPAERRPVSPSIVDKPTQPSVNVQTIKPLVHALEQLFADHGRDGRYRQLLACRNASAQGLLDMFQRLLDILETPSPEFRRELIVAAQRLAGKSGLYPVCYELNGITGISTFSESSGAFADIFKGDFMGRTVCLKAIRMNRATDVQQFLKVCSKEAILWSQLSHRNLLPFYGIYRFRSGLSLVSPWMKNGDINLYLQNHSTADRQLLADDIINGLKFLHENNIIHGDLKGANILVDDVGTACVADFGLSSVSDPNIPVFTSHSSAASKGGSARWQAPELFNPESEKDAHNTSESDVYAYACVLYEIFVGKPPLYQYSRDHTVTYKVVNGERPTRPENGSLSWKDYGLTENIWSLMEDCWLTDPSKRPTVQMITQRLMFGMKKDTRIDGQIDTLAPARFREMIREGIDHNEMSVEAFEDLLKTG